MFVLNGDIDKLYLTMGGLYESGIFPDIKLFFITETSNFACLIFNFHE